MRKGDLFFNVLRVPVDFFMLVIAGLLTYLFRTKIIAPFRPVLFEPDLPFERYFYLVLMVATVFIAAYAISGLYSLRGRMSRTEEFLKIIVASSAGVMGVIVYIFLRAELFASRFLVLGGWFFAVGCVLIGRMLIRKVQHFTVSRFDFGVHKVMIIGDDAMTESIRLALSQNLASGYRVVKHLSNPAVDEVKIAVGNPGIDEVILTNPNYPAQAIVELVDFCHEQHIIFKFVPNIYQTLTTHFGVEAINNVPVIELKRTALDGWGRVFKRITDILFSGIALIVLAPVFAVVAFVVKWDTAGPVFVRVRRVSRNRAFPLLKFRSMVENAEELKPYLAAFNERNDGPLFKMRSDPRVTRVGKFIRVFRIDELPQLWNVLRGDMSIVGPRPHQPDEISQYAKHHKKVLAIKAGATGLAQVSGSSELPFEREVRLDTFYIENWSFWLDMKIMLKTAWKMLTDRSAV